MYIFNDEHKFETTADLMEYQVPGLIAEPQKITFNLKYGQPIPAKDEEGYNPNFPQIRNNMVTFATRGKKFRCHRNRYLAQKYIIWF